MAASTAPAWVIYLGAFVGLIGAVTGPLSLWRTSRNKSLDLRLDLRRSINVLQHDLKSTRELVNFAARSRTHVAAARQMSGSGAMELWSKEVESDLAAISNLSNVAPKADGNYTAMNQRELESALVEVHKSQVEINSIKQKYAAALQEDDEARRYIRDNPIAGEYPRPR